MRDRNLKTKKTNLDSLEVSKLTKQNEREKEIVLRGVMTYNNLESGFYQVDGVRLVGSNSEFKEYLGKNVRVVGVEDTSINIFMVDSVKVKSISILN